MIVQKEPKDKDPEFQSFVFCVFLHDSNDSKDLARTRLWEKVLSGRRPIAIYRTLICLKETSSEEKEARIIDVFQTFCTQGKS